MKKVILSFFSFLWSLVLAAQVGIGTSNPNTNAILDLNSSSKGILIPRLTIAQRNSISSPIEGLMIFNSNTSSLEIYFKLFIQPVAHFFGKRFVK